MIENNKIINSEEMWIIAHQLLSYQDRKVRDLAVYSISMMNDIFSLKLLNKLKSKLEEK